MKKLIFVAVVSMLGVAANAATASWTAGTVYDLAGGDAVSAYGFSSADMTQDAFLALFAVGDRSWETIAETGLSYGYGYYSASVSGFENGENVSIWGALFDAEGNVFVTECAIGQIGGSGQDPSLNIDTSTASTKGLFDAKVHNAFTANGSGWYEAVPEPTSGLLLLLGLGVMALRRKRA